MFSLEGEEHGRQHKKNETEESLEEIDHSVCLKSFEKYLYTWGEDNLLCQAARIIDYIVPRGKHSDTEDLHSWNLGQKGGRQGC